MKPRILFTMVPFLLLVGCNAVQDTQIDQPLPTTDQKVDQAPVGENASGTIQGEQPGRSQYSNDEYGFSFMYPSESTVETRDDVNYFYIRMQNYTPTEDIDVLAPGKWYLEIFVFDPTKGHINGDSCTTMIENAREVTVGTAQGRRGYGPEGGDAGGRRFALCGNTDTISFYVNATENHQDGPIANRILDSFTFMQ